MVGRHQTCCTMLELHNTSCASLLMIMVCRICMCLVRNQWYLLIIAITLGELVWTRYYAYLGLMEFESGMAATDYKERIMQTVNNVVPYHQVSMISLWLLCECWLIYSSGAFSHSRQLHNNAEAWWNFRVTFRPQLLHSCPAIVYWTCDEDPRMWNLDYQG